MQRETIRIDRSVKHSSDVMYIICVAFVLLLFRLNFNTFCVYELSFENDLDVNCTSRGWIGLHHDIAGKLHFDRRYSKET